MSWGQEGLSRSIGDEPYTPPNNSCNKENYMSARQIQIQKHFIPGKQFLAAVDFNFKSTSDKRHLVSLMNCLLKRSWIWSKFWKYLFLSDQMSSIGICGNSEWLAITLSWFASAWSQIPAILIRYPNPMEPATCK